MSYTIKMPYKEAHIMDLNMMRVSECRPSGKLNVRAFLSGLMPIMMMVAIFAAVFILPELEFMASCQNVGGGDVCHLAFH